MKGSSSSVCVPLTETRSVQSTSFILACDVTPMRPYSQPHFGLSFWGISYIWYRPACLLGVVVKVREGSAEHGVTVVTEATRHVSTGAF